MRVMFALLGVVLALAICETPARANPADEAAIRALIDDWYAQQRAADDGRPYVLLAPGAIDASPGYRHIDTGAAVLGPRRYHSVAATALLFNHEITQLEIDTRFARANVWERGYYYAHAAERTYERAGSALLVLEKQADGRWLVLAHQSNSTGIPPNRITDPMPDLRGLYYETRETRPD